MLYRMVPHDVERPVRHHPGVDRRNLPVRDPGRARSHDGELDGRIGQRQRSPESLRVARPFRGGIIVTQTNNVSTRLSDFVGGAVGERLADVETRSPPNEIQRHAFGVLDRTDYFGRFGAEQREGHDLGRCVESRPLPERDRPVRPSVSGTTPLTAITADRSTVRVGPDSVPDRVAQTASRTTTWSATHTASRSLRRIRRCAVCPGNECDGMHHRRARQTVGHHCRPPYYLSTCAAVSQCAVQFSPTGYAIGGHHTSRQSSPVSGPLDLTAVASFLFGVCGGDVGGIGMVVATTVYRLTAQRDRMYQAFRFGSVFQVFATGACAMALPVELAPAGHLTMLAVSGVAAVAVRSFTRRCVREMAVDDAGRVTITCVGERVTASCTDRQLAQALPYHLDRSVPYLALKLRNLKRPLYIDIGNDVLRGDRLEEIAKRPV